MGLSLRALGSVSHYQATIDHVAHTCQRSLGLMIQSRDQYNAGHYLWIVIGPASLCQERLTVPAIANWQTKQITYRALAT